jgi:hypothetical protein
MLKNDYLAIPAVNNFIDWLSVEIGQSRLTHTYTLPDNTELNFQGLAGAFAQYAWPFKFTDPTGVLHRGHTFADSTSSLASIASGLNTNLSLNPINDSDFCDWACALMEWGGVVNGNVNWLKSNVAGLASGIDTVKNILLNDDDDLECLRPIPRFNAGMTKVYSLIVPNFIIYDSRVAASLAWLVAAWCKQQEISFVPVELAFPCMPPKEGENPRIRKSRNPSDNNLKFPSMNGKVIRHARWNMRASWILNECLARSSDTVFHSQSNPLRALEAALFMWGYDLGQNLGFDEQKNEFNYACDSSREDNNGVTKEVIDMTENIEEINQELPTNPGRAENGLNLWGQVMVGGRVPTSHNFTQTLGFYNNFRHQQSGNASIPDFRNWLIAEHGFARGAAVAYCYPLRLGQLFISRLSDAEVRILADQPDTEQAQNFLNQWRGCDVNQLLPRCIADVYIVGHLAQLQLVGGAAQNQIIAYGFAGTAHAARAILTVGHSIGSHFGFLDQQNQPTEFFNQYFS